MYEIAVVTGNRADYGLLRELLFKLELETSVRLSVLVTGTHLSSEFGNTKDEIFADGFHFFAPIEIPVNNSTKTDVAVSAGVAVTQFANHFENNRYDLIIVLGDRYEILSAVFAAHLVGIPIAHISGGDITEGAVDDAIRHSITKMSILHFPGCEQSRKRIIQMGENPSSVFNVGEPGVENVLNQVVFSRDELAANLSFDGIMKDYAVVTFHPATMESESPIVQLEEMISAMDELGDMSFIVTLANADAGGNLINEIWRAEGKKRNNWLVVSSLGVKRYLSAIKYARFVLGNSSSGIIEVPSFKVPTINVGSRQKGRMMAESVISCKPKREDILKAISVIDTQEYKDKLEKVISPYGDGSTSSQIFRQIMIFLSDKKSTNIKHFFDINFDI